MSLESKTGRVIAVCKSPEHGYPTFPQACIAIGVLGIDGDAHSGQMRESFNHPGTFKPNDRPISIVANEVLAEVNRQLGLNMKPGDFNEQIVIEGLGDLGDTPIGSKIVFEGGVILEVVDYAYPCLKLEAHNGPGLITALAKKTEGKVYSKRGILCKVISAGELSPGATVQLISPPPPV